MIETPFPVFVMLIPSFCMIRFCHVMFPVETKNFLGLTRYFQCDNNSWQNDENNKRESSYFPSFVTTSSPWWYFFLHPFPRLSRCSTVLTSRDILANKLFSEGKDFAAA